VCLIEGGGLTKERTSQRLYRGRSVGRTYFPLDVCRLRYFGGSTNWWGGWCRPLDPIDYQPRSWVPHSGWPFGPEELEPYLRRAEAFCQLHASSYDGATWARQAECSPLSLSDGEFSHQVVQFSPPTNFGTVYRDRIFQAPNITTVLHGNVVELESEPEQRALTGVRLRRFDGGEIRVRARWCVVAAGGIENARLLLASNRHHPNGIGNDRDLVGRYFMEHPHVPIGYFLPSSPRYDNRFYERHAVGPSAFKGLLVPSAQAVERWGVLGMALSPESPGYGVGDYFNAWPRGVVMAATRLKRLAQQSRAWALARPVEWGMHALAARRPAGRFSAAVANAVRLIDEGIVPGEEGPPGPARRHRLYCRSEQVPDPNSRVMLDSERDELGMPRVMLDWRLGDLDLRTIQIGAERLATAVGRAGVGRVLLPEGWNDGSWTDRVIGGPHHMGTTRMSDDPSRGVVDRHCRVHNVANLYLAGSSTFPTSGYANPTLTLLALAFRLADHLKRVAA
jgi:choline dehydrogenase-like flavoprotein